MSVNKKRKVIEDDELFQFMNIGPGEKPDSNAIKKALQQNPQSAARKYKFKFRRGHRYWSDETRYPLLQAIGTKSGIDVVEAIYNSYPPAIQEKCKGHTVLRFSIMVRAPTEVVVFLITKWPEGIRMSTRGTLLHTAANYDAPREVLTLLLNIWPDATKEEDYRGNTPFHYCLSLTSVSLLLKHHPDGLKEKNNQGKTPLYSVLRHGCAQLNLVLFHIEKWPDVVLEEDIMGITPYDYFCSEQDIWASNTNFEEIVQRGENIRQVLRSVQQLYSHDKMDNDELKEMMNFFIEIKWWNGILMIFDRHPSLVKVLDIDFKCFPYLFSLMRKRCKTTTMWEVLRNELDLMEGVVV